VRSSGTAEDLAEASFAGQHDSYLDIHGQDDVLDGVRRCWASLWTARACAYRQQKGFDRAEVRLAVVVQTMISSDVSGVMFTANPLTTSTSEIVVNASWGLGEGVVSGMLTPDMFVVDGGTLQVKDRHLGTKAVRVVRNQGAGSRPRGRS
jgi:pyruvate,water dikinase